MRAAFSVFVALFFVSPVCTLFLPFCSTQWILGLVSVAALLFVLAGRWSNEQSDAPGKEQSVSHHELDGRSGRSESLFPDRTSLAFER